jgi:hypothetical protein
MTSTLQSKTSAKEICQDNCRNGKKNEKASDRSTPITYQHSTFLSDLVPHQYHLQKPVASVQRNHDDSHKRRKRPCCFTSTTKTKTEPSAAFLSISKRFKQHMRVSGLQFNKQQCSDCVVSAHAIDNVQHSNCSTTDFRTSSRLTIILSPLLFSLGCGES